MSADADLRPPIIHDTWCATADGGTCNCRPFKPDYDWTSTCPHDAAISECPDGDDGCRCECHAVPDDRPSRGVWRG